MPKITSTTWAIEPHTEAKHAILRKYLDAWLPIITRWHGRVLYIDGFAGPGKYKNGEQGSPIIAIKAVSEHRMNMGAEIKMFFIESRQDRFEHLKKEISELDIPANVKTSCICAEFDEELSEALDYLDEQKKRLAPAFVFIDPFGFTGFPLKTIKRVMENPCCEVLITFMYEEMNRFVGCEKLWGGLTETFGTDGWKSVLSMKEPAQRKQFLRGLYKEQLEREGGAKFVRSFEMRNKANKTDYYLFFGTNKVLGLRKMKEAMWSIDKTGMFQFSDFTHNPNQPMLFELKPNYKLLQSMILQEFKRKRVTIPELDNFIIVQTPFLTSHYKKHILMSMEKTDPPSIRVDCGDKRKGMTYPPRCTIHFL